jgi:hypothetical protein
MKTKRILLATGITLTALLILQLIRRKKLEKKLTVVSEEGYETAEDILFPRKEYLRPRRRTEG